MLFVALGDAEQTRAFFAEFDPAARAIADPEQRLYRAFGLVHGSLGSLISPAVVAAGLRALLKGNLVGKPVGDVRTLPGTFLVRRGAILWAHRSRHTGDHPDLGTIRAAVRALTA